MFYWESNGETSSKLGERVCLMARTLMVRNSAEQANAEPTLTISWVYHMAPIPDQSTSNLLYSATKRNIPYDQHHQL
ncbi:hypothetical protein AN958_00163 [Leucoagaricus sp. SymC.cos]|nr:hypothetical protein AN958_00163 [Leucoagaricus sp. SymC.cos]